MLQILPPDANPDFFGAGFCCSEDTKHFSGLLWHPEACPRTERMSKDFSNYLWSLLSPLTSDNSSASTVEVG